MLGDLLARLGLSGDNLSDVASAVLERQLAPLLGAMRAELLRRVTGAPPAFFAARVRDRGVPLTDSQANALWGVLVECIADSAASAELVCK